MEYKSSTIGIKSITDSGEVLAIVAVTGVIDYGDDNIVLGAFKNTLNKRKSPILFLDQHSQNSTTDAIAKVVEVREVSRSELPAKTLLDYPTATGGLLMRLQFLLDDDRSKAIFLRIKNGLINQYSIGYKVIKSSFKNLDNRKVRMLEELELYEASAVLFGMNSATTTLVAKSYQYDVDSLKQEIELLNNPYAVEILRLQKELEG